MQKYLYVVISVFGHALGVWESEERATMIATNAKLEAGWKIEKIPYYG